MRMLDEGPRGLGGWLILPAIGLVLLPVMWIYSLIVDYLPLLRSDYWALLTTPGSGVYDPLWRSLLLFEVVSTALIVLVDLALAVLFFRKSTSFPRFYIVFLAANVLFAIVEYILASRIALLAIEGDASAISDLVGSAVPAVIWIPYFLRSRRVKNTFVERPRAAQRHPAAAEE